MADAVGAGKPTAGSQPGDRNGLWPRCPGKVVRVLVQTGEAVHARQPVVVIEAMKMENELRATHDGTVAEISGS